MLKPCTVLTWTDSQLITPETSWVLTHRHCYPHYEQLVPTNALCELDIYLRLHRYFTEPCGVVDPRFPILAFSYGEGKEVNQLIAEQVIIIMLSQPRIQAILQWEICDIVLESQPSFKSRVTSIKFGPNETYMTTKEVALKAIQYTQVRKVNIVAQLWHASRCIRQAEECGWRCVSLRGVDAFAPNDPQPWVRHPVSWLLKESRYRYTESQEGSFAVQPGTTV
ncbi:hypothetical protein ACGRH2_25650 [Vibrio barjaei]|uniref:DUF218 domain-containing protein n=1 Tax=Vibrio barjaei TaxID=1676683 RepID=A0ABW7IQW8_9VIBR